MTIIFSLILIVLASPIILSTCFLIKLTSRGPIFFIQERIGLNGRKFRQFKFRSMVQNAESMRDDLLELNEQSGPVFKVSNDPRLTKVGKLIRKYSIDELPQLINVIIGDMNLIGPRPLPTKEVEDFSKTYHHRRHSMKPGITGLWQISGRNELQEFDDWVDLDLEYIDNWNFALDFKIAFKTINVVLDQLDRGILRVCERTNGEWVYRSHSRCSVCFG